MSRSSISYCTSKNTDGTPCACQITRAELKTKENGDYIYCKDNNPLFCGSCLHGTGFHPPGQVPQAGKCCPNDI